MRLSSRPLAAVSCALLMLAACGDDDSHGNPKPDGGDIKDAGSVESGKGGGGGHAGEDASASPAGKGGSGGTGGDGTPMDASTLDAHDMSSAECGNGVVEDGEDCDDHNTQAGDGCNASCDFESGWSCSTDEPTACDPRCGDGKRVGAETADDRCDDHDRDDGDGCDSDCKVENAWHCTGEPSVCTRYCGNSAVDEGETCDDGNATAGDGCTACAVDSYWKCSGAPSVCTADLDANVLISGSLLAALPTRNPVQIQAGVALTGLVSGDTLVAIDRRPMNGMLYGLGYNSSAGTVQLYLVSSHTGMCAAVGSAAKFVATDGSTPVNVSGTQFGMDFNPTVDRIRVVNNQGQNFRINPSTGALVDGDTGSPGTQPDMAVNGGTASLDDCAYTNNSLNQTVTTLYTLDHVTHALYIQNPPNNGVQTQSLALPSTVDFVWGFDIAAGINVASSNIAASGSGFAVVTLSGATQSELARIDLASGAVSAVAPIGTNIVSLALQELDAVPMYALTSDGLQLLRWKSSDPGSAIAVTLGSLTAGETLVDIDFRPATGQLFGVGINATANTGSVYVIDPSSGGATLVGSAGQVALFDGGGTPIDFPAEVFAWSIDFNPTVDRLRVMNMSGLNFRINPNTGAPIDSDGTGPINPDTTLSGLFAGSSGLAGAASTNSWLGATATTLYAIDAAANKLCYLSNANGGTVTGCIDVTLNSQPLDVVTTSEIDFADDVRVATSSTAATGNLYAAISVGGKGHLFTIDVTTGVATDRGQIGAGPELAGFAVGNSSVK